MSILNVNQIQPVGGGNTITVSASDVSASGATITASSFVGNITGNVTSSSTSEFSSGLNVTGGSVGIGTTNPSVIFHSYHPTINTVGKFESGDASVNIRFRDGDTTNEMGIGALGNDFIVTAASGGERLRVTSGGNIGIGTTNPSTKFELSTNNTGAVQNNVIRFTDTDTSFQAGQSPGRIEWNTSDANSPGVTAYIDTYGYTNAVSDLVFGTGAGGSATERLRILHTGNVGIGTDNPISNLQVFGTNGIRITNSANQSATTLLNFESNHPAFRMLNTSGHTTVKFKSDGDSFITSGNLGIGSDSPATILHLENDAPVLTVKATNASSGLRINVKGQSSGQLFRIQDDNTTKFVLEEGGYVGIGTDNPAMMVHIESATPYIRSKNTAAPSDEKTWDFNAGTDGILRFRNINDSTNSANNWLEVERDGVSTSAIRLLTSSGTQRLRIDSVSGYPYVGISTSGTFRDQRLPLSIHGRGFGHGWTQQGTTQDAIYLTAGASGNYSTLTLTVNKVSWGSVAYEIHAAAYSGRHLHRVGGFYQNGNNVSGDHGTTTASSSSTFAISAPGSQQFTMTISGGTWTHPSAWVRLVLSGNGYLRSDLITFSWS